ncbi:MAG: MarR family transcriptional regulator [Rhodoferax sp.]|nr:MarR family transcriptional regulator [Rhodoferax sp.]
MNSKQRQAIDHKVIEELACDCVLTRSRLIARVLTGIYDEALLPFDVKSPQYSLLVVISKIAPASRADIGRFNQLDRSTLTRNLQLLLSGGWIHEVPTDAGGRARPVSLTAAGVKLLVDAAPAWRDAQARSAEVLGQSGVNALMKMGDSMMNLPQAA